MKIFKKYINKVNILNNEKIEIDFEMSINGEILKKEIGIFKPNINIMSDYHDLFNDSKKYIVKVNYMKGVNNDLILFIENIFTPNGKFDIEIFDINGNNILKIISEEIDVYDLGIYIKSSINTKIIVKDINMINTICIKEESISLNKDSFVERIESSFIFDEVKNKLIDLIDKNIIKKSIKLNQDNIKKLFKSRNKNIQKIILKLNPYLINKINYLDKDLGKKYKKEKKISDIGLI